MKKKLLFVPDFAHYAEPFQQLFDITLTRLKEADVILFTGGCDIDPAFYGQKRGPKLQSTSASRDAREKVLFDYAVEAKKPMLGICRGAQLICALAGGKLAQHIDGHVGGDHRIMTNMGEEYQMSSLHHQMMLPDGTDHEMIAWTEKLSKDYFDDNNQPIPDVKTESEIVYFNKVRGLGIQGHPEFLRWTHPEYCRTLKYLNRLVEERLF